MLDFLLRRATFLGMRRGMGGSRAWAVILVLAIGTRALRRLARPDSEVLYRTRVRPGDRFEITARDRA